MTDQITVQSEVTEKKERSPTLLSELLRLLIKIVVIIAVVCLLFIFLFGVFRSADGSMSPAVKDGDLIFFYRLSKRYVASDVIVFEYKGEKQVRRVIAVAGDTVDLTDKGLLINGQPQYEQGIYEETERYKEGGEFPLTLGEGEVFLLGDARKHATDSRIYGAVRTEDTMGKLITILRRRAF